MPEPKQYSKAGAKDPQPVEALTAVLSKHLSPTLTNTNIIKATAWAVLSYAAVNRTGLDTATREPVGAPQAIPYAKT